MTNEINERTFLKERFQYFFLQMMSHLCEKYEVD